MNFKKLLTRKFYIISASVILVSCSNNSNIPDLNNDEKAQIQKINFDETLCKKLKGITNTSFRTMAVENQSGQNIPEHMLPKMIYFKLPKDFDISSIEGIKTDYKKKNYNIYTLNQNDDSLTLVVSKL